MLLHAPLIQGVTTVDGLTFVPSLGWYVFVLQRNYFVIDISFDSGLLHRVSMRLRWLLVKIEFCERQNNSRNFASGALSCSLNLWCRGPFLAVNLDVIIVVVIN